VKYVSPQDVLVIHAQIVDATGGMHGVRDTGLLSAAAERPRATFGGSDLYKDVFHKTAALFESLAMNHVFIDGNKRTAIAVSARFLYVNGYVLAVSNEEMEQVVLNVVSQKPDISEIANWFAQNTKYGQR